ncbi:H-NS family nucleoid-associated regulatory protein [Cupriavidus oxalaticus]|uniref:Histidine biosynthesis protein n=1 Tax=Cupriavidus oxalaticus TaxID=96344 RepID=A0A5P3VT17_9BURK|nr:H-NS family nucleoid-associated regulatory protein [Cupriavidus oxalaticus]QEZ48693.1 histidine biosynthesis protein [Cupriavidus oxalaticus]
MPLALLQDSDTQVLRERAETILWIKTQMARYGLHLADLQNAGCFSEGVSLANASARPICFRDAYGHAWDGYGDLPDWLQRAVDAGQSIEHFRVKRIVRLSRL